MSSPSPSVQIGLNYDQLARTKRHHGCSKGDLPPPAGELNDKSQVQMEPPCFDVVAGQLDRAEADYRKAVRQGSATEGH